MNQMKRLPPPIIRLKPNEQALAAFQQVIERVKSGAADPDQLALSSLGQQARIHLWLGDVAPAAHLYAQQAAQGDPSGGQSLQYVSSFLVNPDHLETLKQVIGDPLIQQLVTIELFARSGNLQMADTDGNGRSAQIISQILALLDGTVKAASPAAIGWRHWPTVPGSIRWRPAC